MRAGEYYLAILNAVRSLKMGERLPDWILKAIKDGPSPVLFPYEAHRAVQDAAERRALNGGRSYISLGLGHPPFTLVPFADLEVERNAAVAMQQLGKEPVRHQSAERYLAWLRRQLETITKSRTSIAAHHEASRTRETYNSPETVYGIDQSVRDAAEAAGIIPPSDASPRPR